MSVHLLEMFPHLDSLFNEFIHFHKRQCPKLFAKTKQICIMYNYVRGVWDTSIWCILAHPYSAITYLLHTNTHFTI